MRTLAIDYGDKRIGLAISDEGGTLASPLEVIEAAGAIERVRKIIDSEGVGRVIVGMPLNMDGSVGPAARKVMDWGAQLGVDVIFVDERLSSFEAEGTLRQRKAAGERLTWDQKKRRLDALAAAAILQDYLHGKVKAYEMPG